MQKNERNPGRAASGFATIASARQDFDVIAALLAALEDHGQRAERDGEVVRLPQSGLELLALLAHFEVDDEGSVQSTTTVQVSHPNLFSDAFEYQHASGDTLQAAIDSGIDQWATLDLPPLLDALVPKPESCTTIQMPLPATSEKPARKRRVVLGPVVGYRDHDENERAHDGEHPALCACCFFTNTITAFEPLVQAERTFAIRFFAMREPDGSVAADCRVNGEDYSAGMEALRAYASGWPGTGFESRKQYVVIHSER